MVIRLFRRLHWKSHMEVTIIVIACEFEDDDHILP